MGVEISVIVFESVMFRAFSLSGLGVDWMVLWRDGQRDGSHTASEPRAGKTSRKRALSFAPLKF